MAKDAEKGLVVYKAKDNQEVQLTVDIVRNFLVTGRKELVTTQELMYFMAICRARGLNPFTKDVYLIKYTENDPAAIITAIDFYRSRAKAQKDCVGWEKGVICLNKETGELRYSKGLVLANEEMVGGWFRAQPVGWAVPFELEVNLSGYIKTTKTGETTRFWRKENQPTMLAKVAESQGLRTLWPDEFRGTITAEEVGLQVDQFDAIDITAGGEVRTVEPEAPALDTSKFDRAIKRLKWNAETLDRLEKWLTDTATGASNKAGKVITSDMIKVSCSNRFEEFLGKFKEWQDLNYPAAVASPVAPGAEGGSAEKAEAEAAAGDEEPEKESDAEPKPLDDRRAAVWDQVINKNIPLAALAVLDPPVSAPGHITEQNINEAEELVATYQAPTGRGKK